MIFDFFRSMTTTYFKPPKPTLQRLEQRQEEWRRKYMPYASPTPTPTVTKPPSPPSLPPPSPAPKPVQVSKPPSITLPKLSLPKPSLKPLFSFTESIRSELRREGVPVWYFKPEIHAPTPERIGMGFRYIFGFASKLAERAEREYESAVVQPVLAKVAPEKFTTIEKVREWKERIPQRPKVWSITERTARGFVTTTYTQKGWKEITHREVLKEIKPAPLSPAEQVKRGVVGGLLRTPIALTGIPLLRMGFKGIATPSGLKKEFIEAGKYIKQRPYEFAAETATTILTPYAYGKSPVKLKLSVAEFPRGRVASLGLEIKKLHGEATFKPLVSFAEPKFVRKVAYPRFVHPEEIAISTETTRGAAEIMLHPKLATPERLLSCLLYTSPSPRDRG